MEAVCRLLAAIFPWCGVVGFAIYVLWDFHYPLQVKTLLEQPLIDVMRTDSGEKPSSEMLSRAVNRQFFEHASE